MREAAHGGGTQAVEALGALFATYWQPLYRYARRLGQRAGCGGFGLGFLRQTT